MKLFIVICLLILVSAVSSRLGHRSSKSHRIRHIPMNSQSRHYGNQSGRRKRSELYITQEPIETVKSITQVMNNVTYPPGDLANIFGSTTKLFENFNNSEIFENESLQPHVRVKRDNPDFNEIVDPIPYVPEKKLLNDDNSIAKNHFEDVYPDSAGLIDYEMPIIKTKREVIFEKNVKTTDDKNLMKNNLKKKRSESIFAKEFSDMRDKGKLDVKAVQSRSIREARELAEKLIAKVNEIESLMGGECWNRTQVAGQMRPERFANFSARNSRANRKRKAKRRRRRRRRGHKRKQSAAAYRKKRKSHRKWDRWSDWSSCSVTCGKGRQIRWRHCIRDCTTAETEMEEKICQLPACPPGKFLGLF